MSLPLMKDGKSVGVLLTSEEGLYFCAEARTDTVLAGIWRAYLQFEKGERLLGVLEPFGEGMRCRRTFARQQTTPLGALRACAIRGGAENGWEAYRGGLPGSFGRRISTGGGAWSKKDETGWQIALPYPSASPFPLTDLFCLASVREINGTRCAVYRFREDGTPTL